MCVAEQLVERRERPGRDDIERLRVLADKILDSLGVHNRRNGKCGRDLAKEGGFFLPALDQMDFRTGRRRERACDNQTGQSRAGAEVEPSSSVECERQELK